MAFPHWGVRSLVLLMLLLYGGGLDRGHFATSSAYHPIAEIAVAPQRPGGPWTVPCFWVVEVEGIQVTVFAET